MEAAIRLGCMQEGEPLTAQVIACVKAKSQQGGGPGGPPPGAGPAGLLGQLAPAADGAIIIEAYDRGDELPMQQLIYATAPHDKNTRVDMLAQLRAIDSKGFAVASIPTVDAIALSHQDNYRGQKI